MVANRGQRLLELTAGNTSGCSGAGPTSSCLPPEQTRWPVQGPAEQHPQVRASSNPETTREWPNSTLLHGDIPAAVHDLEQSSEANLMIMGSGALIGSLIAADLIDDRGGVGLYADGGERRARCTRPLAHEELLVDQEEVHRAAGRGDRPGGDQENAAVNLGALGFARFAGLSRAGFTGGSANPATKEEPMSSSRRPFALLRWPAAPVASGTLLVVSRDGAPLASPAI